MLHSSTYPNMVAVTLFTILVGALLVTVSEGAKPHATCEITYEKVGCFKDTAERALPYELINDRDTSSLNYKGYRFNWHEYKQSIHSLACRCAEAAKKKGYKVFGLQFFAECWSGPSGENTFYKYGQAPKDRCYQDIMNPADTDCNKAKEQECVGGVWTNYVYRLKDTSSSSDKDGGYTKWSEWTKCSKTCGGGSMSRERACTNPKPSGKGKNCAHLGPAEETKPCGEQECPKPCNKALDVGIILDASSSVTLPHFKTAVQFIENLLKYFTISSEGTHVGAITYSNEPKLQFKMSDNSLFNYGNLVKKFNSIKYYGGGTFTDKALEMASNDIFSKSGGDRPDKPDVLIVFTDGRTSRYSKPYLQVLVPLWRKKVRVVAVGIGKDIDMEELKYITYFDQRYAIHVDSFDKLVENLTLILNDSCEGKDR